ncbi:MAG: hypothetical protein RJB39_556 [Candidatus Parcubacteria bacterium]|jgi:hypothetical protein
MTATIAPTRSKEDILYPLHTRMHGAGIRVVLDPRGHRKGYQAVGHNQEVYPLHSILPVPPAPPATSSQTSRVSIGTELLAVEDERCLQDFDPAGYRAYLDWRMKTYSF